MPVGDRKHGRRRRSRRQNRDLIVILVVTLITLAVVFGLLFTMTSSRFIKSTGG